MHYRNGRKAKNGDKIVQISTNGDGMITHVGVLHDAVAGQDYCNGSIAPLPAHSHGACMVDCLHLEDIAAMLKEKSLDKRPDGK